MIRALRALSFRVAALFRNDGDFSAELDSHLQHHIDDNIRAGMTPEAAHREAVLALGGVMQTRERYRDRRRLPIVDTLRQDIVYAVRLLRKSPAFTLTAVATLALGIGANTAIFSVVNAVLLRPLPYRDADRLVMIFATNTQTGASTDVSSYPDYVDWSKADSFESMTAFATRNVTVSSGSEADYVLALRVASTAFDTYRIQPAIGRGFRADEQQPGRSHVVILSDGYWKSRFGGAPDVLGETLRVNEEPYAIIGVMPAGVHINAAAPEEIYVPLVVDPSRTHGFLRVVGRLRPGVTLSRAQAEMRVITDRLAKAYPKSNATIGANAMSLVDATAVNVRTGLFVLLGVVALVLLIACTNVASLMLARGTARRRELSVRAALGADRARIVRQLLTESLLLAGVGGIVGLAVGTWMARALALGLAANLHRAIPRVETTGVDGWVLGFTILISLATGIVFGLAPAFSAVSPDLNATLRDDSRSTTSHRSPRLQRALVVVETALALILLAGAGVLLKSLWTLGSVSRGFESDHVLAVDLWLPQPRFAKLSDRARFFGETLTHLRNTPGVRSAGFVADLPLNGGSDGLGFRIVGRPDPKPGSMFNAGFNIASDDYFSAMRIPVRQGRAFTAADRGDAPGAIVINETAARRFWPNESPLGRQISLPIASEEPDEHSRDTNDASSLATLTVIGVVADVRDISLATAARPEIYLNSMQARLPWPWLVLAVHTIGDPGTLTNTVRNIVHNADPNVPMVKFSTMDQIVSRSMAEPRVYTILLAVFAAVALTLAAVGLYGLVSFTVSQRTHELGIRVALGAARGEILRLVLGDGLRLAAIGAVVGLAGAWACTRVLRTLVHSVEPNDPLAFASVIVLLLAVALIATWLPARRAAQVDPVVALRTD